MMTNLFSTTSVFSRKRGGCCTRRPYWSRKINNRRLSRSLQQPTSGNIYLSNTPLNDIKPSDRTKTLTIAFQESFLFADTVKENILLGRQFTDRELQEAIEIAQANDFISRLPDGLNTLLGERGVTLSGGQRQRVTLARALIGNPQIIFLDDSTSSVDPVIEKRILDGLRTRKNISLVIVAHRLSTINSLTESFFLITV